MEKGKLDIWLCNTGGGYLWRRDAQDKGVFFDYGLLLIKLLYIGQEGFLNVYRRVHTILNWETRTDISNASEEYKRLDKILDDELKNQGLADLTGYYSELADAFYENVSPGDACMVLEDEEQLLFNIILSDVIRNIDGSGAEYLPTFLLEKKLKSDIEGLLKKQVKNPELLNDYLLLDKVEMVSQFLKVKEESDAEMINVWHVKSLAQLLIIEIMNVIKHHDNGIKYTQCKECGRFFVQPCSKGRDRDYCTYPYEDGCCQEKVNRRKKSNVTTIEAYCKKIYGRIRKVGERKKGIVNADKLKKEFETLKSELLSKPITDKEFSNAVEEWWNDKMGK